MTCFFSRETFAQNNGHSACTCVCDYVSIFIYTIPLALFFSRLLWLSDVCCRFVVLLFFVFFVCLFAFVSLCELYFIHLFIEWAWNIRIGHFMCLSGTDKMKTKADTQKPMKYDVYTIINNVEVTKAKKKEKKPTLTIQQIIFINQK